MNKNKNSLCNQKISMYKKEKRERNYIGDSEFWTHLRSLSMTVRFQFFCSSTEGKDKRPYLKRVTNAYIES